MRKIAAATAWVSIVSLQWLVGLRAAQPNSDAIEFFEQRIRPVLVEHCYECHNSAETAEAGLALDYRDAMRRGGDSGSVFGQTPADSLLLQVIRHEIDGVEMPEGGAKLDRDVIEDFEKWLSLDAPDPRDAPPSPEELAASTSWEAIRDKRKQWWSFQPITRPAIPPSGDGVVSRLPVDRFVRAQMASSGLTPAKEASRTVLARRVSFALTGLPPDPAELAAFRDDKSADAYEKYVDRLLDSERFGERWARHWMDWIRYAESHGSEGDPRIDGAHHYRDYLIRSLNADVPYDQLVREHIAGDLLSAPRINETLGINESQLATAYWRMVFHGFAPTDVLEEKVRFTDDAINVFSKAFLGLTVSCARCHNHKFDAISQADYYALFGIIGSARPGRAAIDSPARLDLNRDAIENLKPQIRAKVAQQWSDELEHSTTLLDVSNDESEKLQPIAKLLRTLQAAEDFPAAWQQLSALPDVLPHAKSNLHRADIVQRWDMANPDDQAQWFAYGNGTADRTNSAGEFSLHSDGEFVIREIFPAGVYSHLLSDKHSARFTSPSFPLDGQYDLWMLINGGGSAIARYVVQDYPRNGTVFPVTVMQAQKQTGWRWQKYDLSYWAGDEAHIELATANDSAILVQNEARSWFGVREVLLLPAGAAFNIEPESSWMLPILDRAPLALADSDVEGPDAPQSFEGFAELFRQTVRDAIADWESGQLTSAQALLLNQCLVEGRLPNSVQSLSIAGPLIEQFRALERAVPVPRRAPALAEWTGRDQRLYERGDHQQPRELVPRRFLEAFNTSAFDTARYNTEQSGRLQLAEDVLRTENPLTSRVIVNRIWHHLFGRGIVATNDNFGRLGQLPTHPQLLDYLASEFRTTDGWSIKSMIRRIVTSHTWRQDLLASERARELDPDNRLYSHHSVTRLEAEAIRDSVLAASGQLDLSMFGEAVSGNTARRSVYVQVIRNAMDPFLATFDAPVPFSSKGRRDVTNVPAQSLWMLNNAFVLKAASDFSARTRIEATEETGLDANVDSSTQRIARMWQLALGRQPGSAEVGAAKDYLAAAERRYVEVRARRQTLQSSLAAIEAQVQRIVHSATARLRTDPAPEPQLTLEPIAAWSFTDSADDSVGQLHLKLHGDAKVQDGALVLDGNSWASTAPVPVSLVEKTLEATVQLSDLDQQGGGVLTVQDLGGDIFDSIVFAEHAPRQWLSGSDFHRRTQPFAGAAESASQSASESEASSHSVHIAMTFDADGWITCYRNGLLYGQPYQADLQTFKADQFEVLLGMRHGKSPSGNRMLRGRILQARVYDRALSAEDVGAAAAEANDAFSKQQIDAAMTAEERERYGALQTQRTKLHTELETLPTSVVADQPWIDLAHSLFNMKEFIYVR